MHESITSIEPPSTSYYRFDGVNLRLSHEKQCLQKRNDEAIAGNLLELKAIRDEKEQWEELSHPNSYHSCIDNSTPYFCVPMAVERHDNFYSPGAEDCYKVSFFYTVINLQLPSSHIQMSINIGYSRHQ